MLKGTGVDIVEIDRIKEAVESFGKKFLNRVYTPLEIKYCSSLNKLKFPELAARFAAKEAYAKAIGTGMKGISWQDIEVSNDKRGKPELSVQGKKSKKIFVSLSHSQKYAVATVCIEG